jgi:hypothetical protein
LSHDPLSSFSTTDADVPHLRVECRPTRLVSARYDALPFPALGPTQEVTFDLGITAYHGDINLNGLVFKGYAGHQLLFEQRWPARIIRQKVGDEDLTIPAQTGLAVRGMHFLMHGYELLSMVEVTVVGRPVAKTGDEPDVHAIIQVPVSLHTQQTDLHFPLEGAWWAIQGNDWTDQHKLEPQSQPYALDFVKLGPNGQFFENYGAQLEDHYSWNQPVYATAGGKVAYVCYDMPDLAPGTVPDPRMFRDDARRLLGNAVAISHANGEFSFFASLQQASIQVSQGDMIRRGALIGRVGNSGRSPGPHLHFHVMDGPNAFIDQGLPVKFSHFQAGGQSFDQPTTIPTRMIVVGPART